MAVICLIAWLAIGQERPAHVRSSEPRLRALIDHGRVRSATFRALVERVDALPGIVYVEPTPGLSSRGLGGALVYMVGGASTERYLRVLIDLNTSDNRVIEVVAHELQHALEVFGDPCVVDAATMEALFGRIGIRGPQGRRVTAHMETTAAQVIQAAVAKEFRQPRH